MKHLLALLFLCCPSLVFAQEDGALSVRIEVEKSSEITFDDSFLVVLTNRTDELIRIWNPASKNGYYQISFVFMDKDSKAEFRVQKRKVENPDDWSDIVVGHNLAEEILEIPPQKELKLYIAFKEDWGGLPEPNQHHRYRVWGSFQSDIPAPKGEPTIWNGTVSSFPVSTTLTAISLKSAQDYLQFGFTDTAIKMIKSQGATQLEEKDEWGFTVLQHAAYEKATADRVWKRKQWGQVVQTYLELGAKYDIKSAIYLNDFNRVKAILKESPEQANGILWERNSPLRIAASTGNLEICRYLVENYPVDVNDFKGGGGYPIIKSALPYPNIVKLLIEQGADLKTRITWSNPRSGWWLFDSDATALHYAVSEGPIVTIELLLDHGIDVTARAKTSSGWARNPTALHAAAFAGSAKSIETILNHSSMNQFDKSTLQTVLDECLALSALRFSQNTCRLFLQAGANPNAISEGISVVQSAAMGKLTYRGMLPEATGDKKLIELLRNHGANLDLFSAVVFEDELEVVRLLKEFPETVNSRSPRGYPVLHAAVEVQSRAIVKRLIDVGADPRIEYKIPGRGDESKTALDFAREKAIATKDDPKLHEISELIIKLLEQAARQK